MELINPVLAIGERNEKTGPIFSLEIIEKIVEDFNRFRMPMFGVVGKDTPDLIQISHQIIRLFITDDKKYLYAHLRVNNLFPGKTLTLLIQSDAIGDSYKLLLRGIGNVNENNEVVQFAPTRINVVRTLEEE